MKQQVKTIDYKFSELCEEIDRWKDEAQYWKEKYEAERNEFMEHINQSLSSAEQGVANTLLFALSVKDNPDGSLSISKENRKTLAKSLSETTK